MCKANADQQGYEKGDDGADSDEYKEYLNNCYKEKCGIHVNPDTTGQLKLVSVAKESAYCKEHKVLGELDTLENCI